jgi:hypothetical protein
VLLCCGLVCLAGGITGSVVRNGVTELQLLYFGAIIFTVLGTCAFASIAVVCIRQHPPDDQVPVVWTPVTAAEALGKSRELVNYLIVASRSCFWCRRLTLPDETGVMHVQLLWNDIVQHVLLCQDCMVKYLESGSEGGVVIKMCFCFFVFLTQKPSFDVDGADVRYLFGVVGREGVFSFVVEVVFFHERFFVLQRLSVNLVRIDISFTFIALNSGSNMRQIDRVLFVAELFDAC